MNLKLYLRLKIKLITKRRKKSVSPTAILDEQKNTLFMIDIKTVVNRYRFFYSNVSITVQVLSKNNRVSLLDIEPKNINKTLWKSTTF